MLHLQPLTQPPADTMEIFDKQYHAPGTPPGTLAEPPPATAPATLRLVEFSETEYTEREVVELAECAACLKGDTVSWLHIQGRAQTDMLRELGALLGLHPLALEDVVNIGQRPKFEEYEDQLFVVLSQPIFREGLATTEQVSLFLGEGYVVSFHHGADDPFAPVRRRLQNHTIRGRGADYVFYTLLDMVVDQGFPVLEGLSERLEAMETELLERLDTSTRQILQGIHEVKRELLLLRRVLWPQRDLLSQLSRETVPLIGAEVRPYLRDCHDHATQIVDLVETYREMSTTMLEVYLTGVSNRLNESMRFLTIIATLFIPLTFIVGVYGMNFGGASDSPWAMPELKWHYGYPLVWLAMIAVAIAMLLFFRRRRWL